jgi:hypothetical protein
MVYRQSLPSRAQARKREVYLKSGWGKQWLKTKVATLTGPASGPDAMDVDLPA